MVLFTILRAPHDATYCTYITHTYIIEKTLGDANWGQHQYGFMLPLRDQSSQSFKLKYRYHL